MRRLIFSLPILIFVAQSYAQANNAELGLQLSFPQGAYKKTFPVTASGLIFGIVHKLKAKSPLSVGGEAGILQVNAKNKSYTGYYNNEYNTFLVASSNNIFTLGMLLRLDLPHENRSWKAYIDFTAGCNLFWTRSSISRDASWDILTNSYKIKYYYSDSHIDCSFRGGAGLGVEIPFDRRRKKAVLLKSTYLYGSRASYYGHPAINNTQITLAPKESKTSMLLLETGIRFDLFNKKRKK